eukprot:g36356.t1
MGVKHSRQCVKRHYKLQKKIASGSFGIVWKAKSREDGKEYAVKIIKKSDLKKATDLEAVYKEIKVMERVVHPNCVRFYQ